MSEIFINDLSIFGAKLEKIGRAMTLLAVYTNLCDETNFIDVNKDDLAQLLSRSRRTISSWVKVLAEIGAIKYKYSGKAMINPYYYFKGTGVDYGATKEKWKDFKSDIKEIG